MRDDPTIGVDEQALDDLALEAMAEAYATPPSSTLRARVLASARSEGAARRAARWRMGGAVAAGAALAAAGLFAASERGTELAALKQANTALAERLAEQERTLVGLRVALESQGQVLRVCGGPPTITASLAPKGDIAARGRVVVDPTSGETALLVADLPPATEGKTYELWAIRGDRPPEPAGLFVVGSERALATRMAHVERPGEVSAFAVSIEPTGGSASPTGPIVLVGTVTPS